MCPVSGYNVTIKTLRQNFETVEASTIFLTSLKEFEYYFFQEYLLLKLQQFLRI